MELDFNFMISGQLKNKKLTIICRGIIDSYEAFSWFKMRFFEFAGTNSIEYLNNKPFDKLEIRFIDSYPLSVSVTGFLLKLKERDNIFITLVTNEAELLNYLMSIYLDEKLNVKISF